MAKFVNLKLENALELLKRVVERVEERYCVLCITYVTSVRYVAVINHESRGRVAPEGRVIYYGNAPNGRDISNLCRHNCGFYGNRPSFPGSNRFFCLCFSRALTPRVVPTPFLLPAPALDCYLPATAIDTPPAAVFHRSLAPLLW